MFHRLRLSPVLGFILVGVAVGPFGIAMLADRLPLLASITLNSPETIAPIAELGISTMMFMIGLEMSLERLRMLRRLVFGLGLLQFVLCAAAISAIAYMLHAPAVLAVIVGPALAMSSTAVVVQVLSQEERLAAPVGRASLAILLLQDLAAVPVLFLLSVFGASGGSFTWSIAEAVVVVLGLIIAGRLVLRPLFRSVARTGSPELFVAACLLAILATGLATRPRPADGTRLADRRSAAGRDRIPPPDRGDDRAIQRPAPRRLSDLHRNEPRSRMRCRCVACLIGIVVLVAIKACVITRLARAFGLRWLTGVQAGLLLGPGGEFGFVILGSRASKAYHTRRRALPPVARGRHHGLHSAAVCAR